MNPILLLPHAAQGAAGFRFEMPPLHPILVNFTAALLPASLFSDLSGRVLHKQSLMAAGWWTLLYTAIISPFTAIAGWVWLRQMGGMDMPAMPVHKWLGTALAAVFLGLVWWRWRIYRRGDEPTWPYLICSVVVVGALTLQGHLGGAMSFGSGDDSSSSDHPTTMADNLTTAGDHSTTVTVTPTSSPHDHESNLQWRDHIDLKDER